MQPVSPIVRSLLIAGAGIAGLTAVAIAAWHAPTIFAGRMATPSSQPAAFVAPTKETRAPVATSPIPAPVTVALPPTATTDGAATGAGEFGAQRKAARKAENIRIVQIGDSHTAADFFTGGARRLLQQRYGNGGPGYVIAGKPHIGVRHSVLKTTTSPGWTYKTLQRSSDIAEFALSGFNAVATAADETLTLTADHPLPYDVIEIEMMRQPGGGAFELSLDGKSEGVFDLAGETTEPLVVRVVSDREPTERVKQIEIKTTREGITSIASAAVFFKRSGLTYSNIGFPGATIGIVNKFDQRILSYELQRLDPHIVVLAFGTNEAFKESLDPADYREQFEKAIERIRTAVPRAQIVLVGPPDVAVIPAECRSKDKPAANCRKDDDAKATNARPCKWPAPPKLAEVRKVQQEIAQRQQLQYWNWAEVMPNECGAERWASAQPALMARDLVHFTQEGYALSSKKFVSTLIPIIEGVRNKINVVSNR